MIRVKGEGEPRNSVNADAPTELVVQNQSRSTTVARLRDALGMQNGSARTEPPTESTPLLAVPQTLYSPPCCIKAEPDQGQSVDALPRYR